MASRPERTPEQRSLDRQAMSVMALMGASLVAGIAMIAVPLGVTPGDLLVAVCAAIVWALTGIGFALLARGERGDR